MQRISSTISKNQDLPIGLDYYGLRAEGIRLLQALSGEVWTDYNDHDPGVTILEALCYALTDLSNRAQQPIPDLLARPPGAPSLPNSPLVPAPEAFANHPVTLNDYRKLLLGDAQLRPDVRNVWIKAKNKRPGEYVVRVGLHHDAETPGSPASPSRRPGLLAPPTDRPALAARLLLTLNQHRNLGEQFVKVVFLEPHLVGIGGRLDMQGTQLPEDVLVEALWCAYALFQSTVPRYDLASWPSLPGPAEEVLAGPLHAHELLQESDLAPQLRQVGAALLQTELSRLPCLRGVADLSLYEPGQAEPAVLVQVSPAQELLLDVETSLRRLSISYKGVLVSVDLDRARLKFERRRTEQQRALRRPLPPSAPPPEPPGRFLDLGHYDSIQHSFPAVYGLGLDGLPVGASLAQHANTLQLKGYLLFFEQLMANFCAQLSNAEELLAARPVTLEHQLFAQRPTDIPELQHLLDEPPQASTSALGDSYLRALAEDPSALRHRRDTLLTHLLARFGYVIAPFHPAPNDPDGIPRHSLMVRERLLQRLNTVIYYRGAARVALGDNSPYDVSGLELFIYLLTGIRYFQQIAQHEQLAMLEEEVQLGPAPAGPTAKLVVHEGAGLDFPAFLAVQQRVLAAPAKAQHTDLGHLALADVAGSAIKLELLTAERTTGISAPQQVLHYLRQLDERLNRFLLLDHCTLKPAQPEPATDPQADPDAPYSFYEFQVSICLAAFTQHFQLAADASPTAVNDYQEYVQNLILTHAPAHLLVHIIWLNYPQMKDLESRYERFVAVGGLRLGDDGRDPARLRESQLSLTEFLRPHLS